MELELIQDQASAQKVPVNVIESETQTRYMYNKTKDRVQDILNRMKEFSQSLEESEGLELSKQSVLASQESVTISGRVCCEVEGGKLNDKTVFLETSPANGNGQRIRLDLKKLSEYSLFPGQIVVVQGENPSGYCLVVSRIVDFCPRPFFRNLVLESGKKVRLEGPNELKEERKLENLHILVAGGPFMSIEQLDFNPLEIILKEVDRRKPNLLLLMGPFLNPDNPKIKNGILECSFEEFFKKEVLLKLENTAKHTSIVLVPSLKDSNHQFIFPQPEFKLAKSSEILSVGNPGYFTVEQIGLAVCTTDILRHLSIHETRRVPVDTQGHNDRLSDLCRHIIGQRCMYPLSPHDLKVPLDISSRGSQLQPPYTPDILLLSSDLNPFVKLVKKSGLEEGSTLCINPGKVSKGSALGTFADIKVWKLNEVTDLDLGSQAKAEIIKL